MAAVKGVNATKADFPIGSSIIDQGTMNSKVVAVYDQYTAAALETASTITMGGKIPKGARIVDLVLFSDDMGSTVTMKVGDAGDDDRYIAAGSNVTNANDRAALNLTAGFGYQVTGVNDDQIVITTAGIWTGTIKMILEYMI